jgi:hypothetical protein
MTDKIIYWNTDSTIIWLTDSFPLNIMGCYLPLSFTGYSIVREYL